MAGLFQSRHTAGNAMTAKRCSVEACQKKHYGKGLCNTHYMRLRRGGSLDARRAPDGAGIAFLQAHASHRGRECLIWPFGKTGSYGAVHIGARSFNASHLMCLFAHGEPNGESRHALHSCDNPPCVNPSHLRWATHKDNMNDMTLRGRRARGSQHKNAVLTEKQVVAIRQDNRTAAAVAREYGCAPKSVSRIRTRETWAWLNNSSESVH